MAASGPIDSCPIIATPIAEGVGAYNVHQTVICVLKFGLNRYLLQLVPSSAWETVGHLPVV